MLPIVFILFILGLAVGSFLNACAYRIPRGISIVNIPSACTICHKLLRWRELVPLVSFALQRGRCRSCQGVIPWRYPFFELGVATGLIVLFQVFGATSGFLLKAAFFLLMTLISVIDWEFLIIPNSVVIVGALAGITLKAMLELSSLSESLLTAFISLGVALAVRVLANLALGRQGLGMGDVKLAWILGLFLGFELFLVCFWLASLLGGAYGLLRPKDQRPYPIPFGSFLAITSVVVFVFDERILKLLSPVV